MNISKCLDKYNISSLVLLRVILGVIFLAHGYQKLMAADMTINFVGKLGFPMPELFGWLLILTEFVGGIALVLGLFTRFFAFALIIAMAVALFGVHLKNGLTAPAGAGYEYVLTLLGALVVILMNGAKKLSLDHWIFKDKI